MKLCYNEFNTATTICRQNKLCSPQIKLSPLLKDFVFALLLQVLSVKYLAIFKLS